MLHLGCVGSYQDAKIIPATIKILQAAGEKFTTFGEDESCCGYLAYLVGDMPSFDKAAKANVQKFKKAGIKNLVTTCAGCHKTFNDLYPKHGHKNGVKTEHVVQTLERLIAKNKLKFKKGEPAKVALSRPLRHRPAHGHL